MGKELTCIVCPRGCRLTIDDNLNVTGNSCPRGAQYAKDEMTNPKRMIPNKNPSITACFQLALIP